VVERRVLVPLAQPVGHLGRSVAVVGVDHLQRGLAGGRHDLPGLAGRVQPYRHAQGLVAAHQGAEHGRDLLDGGALAQFGDAADRHPVVGVDHLSPGGELSPGQVLLARAVTTEHHPNRTSHRAPPAPRYDGV
jgi:hypothetical protein